jgi:hypothetical protein
MTATLPPGASEFRRYIDHTRTSRDLPDMALNGNMGAFSKWAQELALQFKQYGYDGFERSLKVLMNNERLVMTALSMPSPDKEPQEVGILLSDVKPEAVHWLWPGYLALRKLHTFDGDPGLGKSTLLFNIIARLDVGSVLICLEDGLEDTIQPRLAKAGADLRKIVSIGFITYTDEKGVKRERPFNLAEDRDILEAAIKRVNARVVMIDPVMAILGGKDIYKDNEVRTALSPLKELAERCNVAIVMIRHITKGGSDKAIYLGGGSIAFIGLSRIGWLAVRNPDNEAQCIFANIKNNLGKPAPKLLYSVVSDEGSDDERPYIKWEGESKHTDQELLSKPTQVPGQGRQAILKLLKETFPGTMTPSKIAAEMDLTEDNVNQTLRRMVQDDQVRKVARGVYAAHSGI